MNILIVEDEVTILEIMKEFFESSESFSAVLTASNGQEALDIISEEKVDFLLTDINMPRMDGIELIEEIIKRDLPLKDKIIVMSGYTQNEEKVSSLNIVKYFQKPIVSIIDLVSFISNYQ